MTVPNPGGVRVVVVHGLTLRTNVHRGVLESGYRSAVQLCTSSVASMVVSGLTITGPNRPRVFTCGHQAHTDWRTSGQATGQQRTVANVLWQGYSDRSSPYGPTRR